MFDDWVAEPPSAFAVVAVRAAGEEAVDASSAEGSDVDADVFSGAPPHAASTAARPNPGMKRMNFVTMESSPSSRT